MQIGAVAIDIVTTANVFPALYSTLIRTDLLSTKPDGGVANMRPNPSIAADAFRQREVAKIVQCGEALAENRTSLVSTEHC
jgi:hypothetical protein